MRRKFCNQLDVIFYLNKIGFFFQFYLKKVEIINVIEAKIKQFNDKYMLNSLINRLYLSKKAINILRDLYR